MDGARKNLQAEVTGCLMASPPRQRKRNGKPPLRPCRSSGPIRQTFYTAAYHSLLARAALSDVDGQPDGKVRAVPFTFATPSCRYGTLSRAENPLLALTQPATC